MPDTSGLLRLLLRVLHYLRTGSLAPQKRVVLSTAGALPDLMFCLGLSRRRGCGAELAVAWGDQKQQQN